MKIHCKFILLLLLMTLIKCGDSSGSIDQIIDLDSLYPETALKGWELNSGNTGLCDDYTGLDVIDPATVGSVDGVTLYIRVPDITISHKQINYPIAVEASNVIIEHCLIKPTACGYGVPIVQVDNTTIRDSEVDCDGIPIEQAGFSITVSGVNCIIERCNIHGASSGISIQNTSASAVSVAQGNYIHDLRLYTDTSGNTAHIDGLTIRISSGKGVIVRNNYILVEPDIATGPVFIQAWAGHINNVLVEGNLLQGYGYSLALEYNAYGYGNNMQAINNRIDAWTSWYCYVSGGPGWHTWENNCKYNAGAEDCAGDLIAAP